MSQYEGFITVIDKIKDQIEKHKETESLYMENKELIGQLNNYALALQKGETWPISELNLDFMATSILQDVAIACGWGDEFLKIAKEFDAVYESYFPKTKETDLKQEEESNNLIIDYKYNNSKPHLAKFSGRFDTPGLMNSADIFIFDDHLLYNIESTPQFNDGTSEFYEQGIEEYKKNGPIISLDFLKPEEIKEFNEWLDQILP